MSRAARSIFYFGWYLVILGFLITVIPNTILTIFRVPATSEVWIRVLGIATIVVGYFYIQAARHNLDVFFRFTLQSRPFAFVTFSGLVLLGLAPGALFLFGAIELLGAAWTWWALREP